MALQIEFSQRAEQDIEESFLRIKADAPMNAVRWRRKLEASLKLLEEPSIRFGFAPENEHSEREVRQLLFGRYRILHTVDGDVAYILTVRHGARRFMGGKEVDSL
ncbi:MAG: type II toxin-antitoxin system RelE/ParE family toxin [Planctomycetota bacterium]|nr:type II toxin-antitoxin system RelE/ParE family toxin [Planctomycetota bacterium]MDA1248201.1 type II toxin-antitoxin system RelE/ParE family toxin [Planctomycetota bacterium]